MTNYCGNKQKLPDTYEGFATRYECLKKGYGICKYTGKMGTKKNENPQPEKKKKEKVYCGNDLLLPDGYDRFATRHECLKRGFGVCLYKK